MDIESISSLMYPTVIEVLPPTEETPESESEPIQSEPVPVASPETIVDLYA
ncbi:MAG: hypothetical protein NT080_13925 [Spirochaetes bacterium]|nr:hypothetical protein [Spirochaetota bacterium]